MLPLRIISWTSVVFYILIMRGRKRGGQRPDYQPEVQTVLKYFKKEIVKEAKETFPDKNDEELVDQILTMYRPVYKSYSYALDSADEFVMENPFLLRVMKEYLTFSCNGCSLQNCMGSHESENLRRSPQRLFNGIWNYLPVLCKVNNCASDCEFSHNIEESVYHPMTYKTTLCQFPTVNNSCKEKGKFCPFAHGDLRKPSLAHLQIEPPVKLEEEKKAPIEFSYETFKTFPCQNPLQHDRNSCNFYHDHKDCRRDQSKYNYCSQRCPVGFNKDFKCRYKEKCKYSHNEIEENFHKEIYQTKPCKGCSFIETCPFSHKSQETSKENIEESLQKYMHANKVLREELESIEEKMQEIKLFLCFFCNTEASESILMCGHLTCSSCIHGDYCRECFKPIYPITQIKLV